MSQRRSALGRGLGALISGPPARAQDRVTPPEPPGASQNPSAPIPVTPERVTSDSTPGEEKMPSSEGTGSLELEIASIDPNPEQPRREFDAAALEQLSRSIAQHGVLQPVVVRRAGERFELIMGERRFRASQLAKRKTIPAVIADVASADRLELAIVENVQRQDLNPVELAHAYRALADAGHTQDEIGRKVAMDRSSIANHLRLLDLSRGIQADLEGGQLSMGHAKALLQVQDVEAREGLRSRIRSQGLSVRAAEQMAREIARGGAPAPSTKKKPSTQAPASLDADTRAFVESLERHLQTKVALHPSGDGGGRLEIKYFSLEDLERLGAMLLGQSE